MLKRAQRNAPHCALLHRSENRVPQFGEAGGGNAQQAVGDDKGDRNGDKVGVVLRRQRIDRAAVDDRHVHRGHFGEHEASYGEQNAHVRAHVALGPEIRKQ